MSKYKLEVYHKPTMMEHALALQDNCEKYFDGDTCVGCEFTNNKFCKIADVPKTWETNQNKLTKTERGILEFWEKQGAEYVDGFLGGVITYSDENKAPMGTLRSEYVPNTYEIVGKSCKKIDDLLKGEDE